METKVWGLESPRLQLSQIYMTQNNFSSLSLFSSWEFKQHASNPIEAEHLPTRFAARINGRTPRRVFNLLF
jgi:hypothetical protein